MVEHDPTLVDKTLDVDDVNDDNNDIDDDDYDNELNA